MRRGLFSRYFARLAEARRLAADYGSIYCCMTVSLFATDFTPATPCATWPAWSI